MDSSQFIFNYFPDLSNIQRKQFDDLSGLYTEWNKRINIISRKDIGYLYERHVLHSLGIAKIVRFSSDAMVLDAGTGGGFPGIPLAILFPDTQFVLADSIGKKIMAVSEITHSLGLRNVTPVLSRVEKLTEHADFIVCRAVTTLSNIYSMCRHLVRPKSQHSIQNGILCLKGGEMQEEIRELRQKVTIFELKDFFNEEFFITKKVVHVPVKGR